MRTTHQIDMRTSVIVDSDICKEYLEEFEVKVFFKFKGGNAIPVRFQKSTYSLPKYFHKKNIPPYCFLDKNLTVSALMNAVRPEQFMICIKEIEVCEMCDYCTSCEKINNTGESINSHRMIHKQVEKFSLQKIRIIFNHSKLNFLVIICYVVYI